MIRPNRLASIAVALLLAIGATSLDAQSWSAGLKSGVGQLRYTGAHEFGWRTSGPNATLFAERSDSSRFSQLVEVGSTRRLGVSNTGGSMLTFTANYLDIVLLTKLHLVNALGVRPYLAAGPTLTYGLDCNLQFVTGGLTSNTACDDETGINRVDVGVAAAAGFNFALGPTTLVVEARGATSFRSVVVPLESQNSRSLGWSVLAGMSFPLRVMAARRPVVGPRLPALEPIRIPGIAEPQTIPAGVPPLAAIGDSSRRISLTAADADVRTLLLAIAREAGISLVVSTDVRRRVSVSFTDAAPAEAIRAIIAEAGLTVVDPPAARTVPTIVYYQLPVNINEAPAEAVAARFGVSAELARWIVESRAGSALVERQP